MSDDRDVRCRCGERAPLDVMITASKPALYPYRSELHMSAVACRRCAFDAAKMMLAFLESKGAKA